MLDAAESRFDVSIGSYPGTTTEPGRVNVRGTDREAVERAIDWLRDRIDTVPPPDRED